MSILSRRMWGIKCDSLVRILKHRVRIRCFFCASSGSGTRTLHSGPFCPYNTKVIDTHTPLMVTDTVQDKRTRRLVQKSVEGMSLRLLQRIAYECRCEELGIHPDSWKLYLED